MYLIYVDIYIEKGSHYFTHFFSYFNLLSRF